jgi:class 3 adenylate cyclase
VVAFLAADVVGYSRLIRADEEGALTTFQLRNDMIYPKSV